MQENKQLEEEDSVDSLQDGKDMYSVPIPDFNESPLEELLSML